MDDQEKQLWDKEKELRAEKKQLRDEKIIYVRKIDKAEESGEPPNQAWMDKEQKIDDEIRKVNDEIVKVGELIEKLTFAQRSVTPFLLQRNTVLETRDQVLDQTQQVVEAENIERTKALVDQVWKKFVENIKLVQENAPIDFANAHEVRCRHTSNNHPWMKEQPCSLTLEDILSSEKVQIPVPIDIYRRFYKNHVSMKEYATAVEVTMDFFAEHLPEHEMYAVCISIRHVLEQVDFLRDRKPELNETIVQNLCRPLFELLQGILQAASGTTIQLNEMRRAGPKIFQAPNESSNFIKPEKKLDFSIVCNYKSIMNGVVIACLELKVFPAQGADCMSQIIEAMGGPQWVHFLYYGVPFFFAYTGDSTALKIHRFSPTTQGTCTYMKADEVCAFEVKNMGLDLVHFLLRSMMYNKMVFTKKLSHSRGVLPYKLKTTFMGKGRKKRCYYIGGLTGARYGGCETVVIRLDDEFPPWIEKCTPKRKDLANLYRMSRECANLAQMLKIRKGIPLLVTPSTGEIVRWLGPVGHHPGAVVETPTHVLRLAADVLRALVFLHSNSWVHCDVRIQNIVRRTDCESFVLIDLECAQQISDVDGANFGTAKVPDGLSHTLIRDAAMMPPAGNLQLEVKLPSRWRPFYDLSQFIGAALRTAVMMVSDRLTGCAEEATNEKTDLAHMNDFLKKFLSSVKEEDDERQRNQSIPLKANIIKFVGDANNIFKMLTDDEDPKKSVKKRGRTGNHIDVLPKAQKTGTTSCEVDAFMSQARKSKRTAKSGNAASSGRRGHA